MKLFRPPPSDPSAREMTARQAEVWAFYELAHTLVDFTAAGLFVVGSVLFFFASTTYAATWLFVIGSVFFGLKPTLRLTREIRLVAIGRAEDVARELED